MKPFYEPLHEPKEKDSRLRQFLLGGIGLSTRAKNLLRQMERRASPPDEIWGKDKDFRVFAKNIARLICEEMDWPNANFIPEDPFHLVVCNVHYDGDHFDGMEIESVCDGLSDNIGRELEEREWGALCDLSFGEAVAYLHSAADAEDPISADFRRRAPAVAERIGTLPCPSVVIFLDLRSYLQAHNPALDIRDVRPSSEYRALLDKDSLRHLSRHVAYRFDVRLPDFFRYETGKLFAVLTVAAVAIEIWLLLMFYGPLEFTIIPFSYDIAFGLFGLCFAVCLGFYVSVTFLLNRSDNVLTKKSATLADLVRWIRAERVRKPEGFSPQS